jgi:hypothetical protein
MIQKRSTLVFLVRVSRDRVEVVVSRRPLRTLKSTATMSVTTRLLDIENMKFTTHERPVKFSTRTFVGGRVLGLLPTNLCRGLLGVAAPLPGGNAVLLPPDKGKLVRSLKWQQAHLTQF